MVTPKVVLADGSFLIGETMTDNEPQPQSSEDLDHLTSIDRLIQDIFPDDIYFILEQLEDEDDVVGFLYGQLLDIGEDPDEVLQRYGITEAGNEI